MWTQVQQHQRCHHERRTNTEVRFSFFCDVRAQNYVFINFCELNNLNLNLDLFTKFLLTFFNSFIFPLFFWCSVFVSLSIVFKVRVVAVVAVVVASRVAHRRVAHRRVAHRRVAHRRVAHRRVQQHKLHHKQAAATINTGLTNNVNTKAGSPTLFTPERTKRMVVT